MTEQLSLLTLSDQTARDFDRVLATIPAGRTFDANEIRDLMDAAGTPTQGNHEVAQLHNPDTRDDPARPIAASPEGAVPVWRPRAAPDDAPSGARFIGMISALDIAAFVAAAGVGDRSMRAVVGEVVQPNPALLREIDPGTR